MRAIHWLGVLTPVLLGGCTPEVYENQTTALHDAMGGLNGARTTFAARPSLPVNEAAALVSGNPIHFRDACVVAAKTAEAAADQAAGDGASLGALYGPGGPMAHPPKCVVSLLQADLDEAAADDAKAAAAAPATPAAADVDGSAKPPLTIDQEIAADEQVCQARRGLTPPKPPKNGPLASDAAAGADPADSPNEQLWAGVQAYVDGLAKLSSSDEAKRLSDATSGAAGQLQSLSDKAKGGPAGAAVGFLFAVVNAAIAEARYEDLKTSVVCGDGLLLKWRDVMKDSLRYEQVAAYSVRARKLDANVKFLRAVYDDSRTCPDPPPSGSAAELADRRCTLLAARAAVTAHVGAAGGISLSDRFGAVSFLNARATGLQPRLADAASAAAAVNSLGASDPGPAVDAFIEAHRALRNDMVSGKGEGKALIKSFKALYDAGDTLNKALKAAKADAAKGDAATGDKGAAS